MIVPDGTLVRSTKRRKVLRRVVEIRQLGDLVLYLPYYGKWRQVQRTSLDGWDRWCKVHKAKVVRP